MNYEHWEYEPETRTVLATDIEDGITLATVEPYDDADDIGRLIACAPEMYRLLNKAHSILYRFMIEKAIDVVDLKTLVKESVELLARIDGEEEIITHEETD